MRAGGGWGLISRYVQDADELNPKDKSTNTVTFKVVTCTCTGYHICGKYLGFRAVKRVIKADNIQMV